MGAKQTFIEINGRRYHADTGHPAAAASAKAPRPKSKVTVRQTANHAARHQPTTSHTLMRRAVKKPAPKGRRITAHGRLDTLAKQFLGQIEHRTSILQLDEKRLQRAKRIKRSQAVSRFPRVSLVNMPPATPRQDNPVARTAAAPPHPAKPLTTAELLERAVQQATSHEQPPVKLRRRGLRRSRLAT
jgi:hypothetical protein